MAGSAGVGSVMRADRRAPVALSVLGGRLRLVMMRSPGDERCGDGEYRESRRFRGLWFPWAWDRPEVAAGTPLVEIDCTQHSGETTTVVLTRDGLVDEQSQESHRAGGAGSFDNLARMESR